jgi:hypothetical protein
MAPAGQALSRGGYLARSSAPLWLQAAFFSTSASAAESDWKDYGLADI